MLSSLADPAAILFGLRYQGLSAMRMQNDIRHSCDRPDGKSLHLMEKKVSVARNEPEMPQAMGVVVTLFQRGGSDCGLRQLACSGWLASVA